MTTRMDPTIKARWVAALRSGDYQQGKHKLKDANGYCCLGVLCDLYAKEHGVDMSTTADNHYFSHPNLAVRDWAGLPPVDTPAVEINMSFNYLTNHNDSGRTFAEIADAIEAQL